VLPRDQNSDFKQQTVALYKRTNNTIEAFVTYVFQKGVTTAKTANLIDLIYAHYYASSYFEHDKSDSELFKLGTCAHVMRTDIVLK